MSFEITVDVEGLSELTGPVADIEGLIAKALDSAGIELVAEVQKAAKFKTPTGRLRSSIGHRVRAEVAELDVGILTATSGKALVYARVRDEGTGYLPGGVISGNPWLVFKLPDGTWRKVRSVKQSGTGYLSKTVPAKAPTIVPEAFAAAFASLGG